MMMNEATTLQKKTKNQTKKKPKSRSGWIMLTITLILYIVVGFLDYSVAQSALNRSFQTLKIISPILLVVFFLLAVLNGFIKPKKIAQYLGKESGFKGEIIAVVGGILSHGPSYLWYPILSELRNHGARDGLIVAFVYARAIKLPWLLLMVSYFGFAFTVILSTYTLLAALLQAFIVDKLTLK